MKGVFFHVTHTKFSIHILINLQGKYIGIKKIRDTILFGIIAFQVFSVLKIYFYFFLSIHRRIFIFQSFVWEKFEIVLRSFYFSIDSFFNYKTVNKIR